jgi:uncharacterized membrane protein
MIIMALDHVRGYFHRDNLLYDPTDLGKTSGILFFTRWITHFCAPVFIFLAGVSAHIYGARSGRPALARFLWTRGIWLVFAEIFIVTLGWFFNPTYPFINLQVIWAIGVGMIVLSALIYLPLRLILAIGLAIVAGHDLLDNVQVNGNGPLAITWAALNHMGTYTIGRFTFFIHFPVLAWLGVLALGYAVGYLYRPEIDPAGRKSVLISLGAGALTLFIILRAMNRYGDPAEWSVQSTGFYTFLSFLNVSKYPPSLLYVLVTLGPAMLFLALTEQLKNTWTDRIRYFGRVPMFYYLAHIYLIHLLAIAGAAISIHNPGAMLFLHGRVASVTALKGYGFNLLTVYLIWISVIILLYPLCKRFDAYKRAHQATQWWLRYL